MIEKIKQAAREAGKIMLDAEDIRHSIDRKSGHANFVTLYDKKVQAFLFDRLSREFPEARFIGEEDGADEFLAQYSRGFVFCIDPIDGTSNFLTGYRPSVTSIALLKDGKPYAAVVYEPYRDLMFSAVKGEGAFLNDQPIHSSDEPLSRSMVSFGTSPYHAELTSRSFDLCKKIMPRCIDLRRSGSAAWDICQVAMGVTGLFFECILQLWDFAAAGLILEEAGGRISDMDGRELAYNGESSILCVSRGVLKEGNYQTIFAQS